MNGQFVFYGWTGLMITCLNCWNGDQKMGFWLWHHFSIKEGGSTGKEGRWVG